MCRKGVKMSDKEFKEFIKPRGILMCHVWGYTGKDMEDCWHTATVRATEAERRRIADLARKRASEHVSPHSYLLNDFADLLEGE